jgi:hypothetical protein
MIRSRRPNALPQRKHNEGENKQYVNQSETTTKTTI